MSGQWIPYPPPHTSQEALSLREAFRSLGYQVRGTEIDLPSIKSITNESLVK
jgi:hypothetical protein